MSLFGKSLSLLLTSFALSVSAHPSRSVTVWNTLVAFAPETIIDVSGPVPIDNGLEFPLFPFGAFYDIDVGRDEIVMTMKDSSPASFLLFPDGVSDIYYFDLGTEIDTATLIGATELNEFATVEVVPPTTTFTDVVDDLGFNITLPFTVENGGLIVTLGPGSDYSIIGNKVMLAYTVSDDDDSDDGGCRGKKCNKKSKRGGKKGQKKRL